MTFSQPALQMVFFFSFTKSQCLTVFLESQDENFQWPVQVSCKSEDWAVLWGELQLSHSFTPAPVATERFYILLKKQ